MLELLRRYQRFLFLVITVVIVISFSFFGTYSTITSDSRHEEVVFQAVDGSNVTRSDVEEMVLFLGTDSEDKIAFGGAWGPNFLNDGVIYKDFLDTGIGEVLAMRYLDDLKGELRYRFDREKRYVPYTHPQARFLNAESAWGYYAPELKARYEALKRCEDGADRNALSARVQLFLAQKRFPSHALRQVLLYQEQQYDWITHDPNLAQEDLSLFRYHTVEDWFGRRYVRLVAQFVINAAKEAERRGYVVTREEALAELMNNAQLSYQQVQSSPSVPIGGSGEYMDEHLRRMGMDSLRAVKIWKKVLLFRRLFHDVGDSILVDALTYDKFNDYANQSVLVDMYQLPRSLRLGDDRSWQKFELYLQVVAQGYERTQPSLVLPTAFLTPAVVQDDYPELVQRRYLLSYTQADKKHLEARVGVKDSWVWQVQDDGWRQLQKRFPDLGIVQGSTAEERFAALDALDQNVRAKVDAFARAVIVEEHPEWLVADLEEGVPQQKEVSIRLQGGTLPFEGISDRAVLIALLDNAPIGDDGTSATEPLASFSQDGVHYYNVSVLDRSDKEVLTFAEASADNTLDQLIDRTLENYYSQVRGRHGRTFKRDDGRWKLYKDVKRDVADLYFGDALMAIKEDYLASVGDDDLATASSPEQWAARRLFRHVHDAKKAIENDSTSDAAWVFSSEELDGEQPFATRKPLEEQWKLGKSAATFERSEVEDASAMQQVFSLKVGGWSSVLVPPHGDVAFFQVVEKGAKDVQKVTAEKMDEARRLLGIEAQKLFMMDFLQKIGEKEAIKLPEDEETSGTTA